MTYTEPDRPVLEIEITEEMLEAGLFELGSYDPESDRGDHFVRSLFTAMISQVRADYSAQLGP